MSENNIHIAKEPKIFSNRKASKCFLECFPTYGSSLVKHCVCGRVYVGPEGSGDFEEGEYEGFLKRSENGDKSVVMTNEWTGFMHIFGFEVVDDCPCNFPRFIEEILVTYSNKIIDFYSNRVKALRAETESLMRLEDLKDGTW